jgi:hypothetical protein
MALVRLKGDQGERYIRKAANSRKPNGASPTNATRFEQPGPAGA